MSIISCFNPKSLSFELYECIATHTHTSVHSDVVLVLRWLASLTLGFILSTSSKLSRLFMVTCHFNAHVERLAKRKGKERQERRKA